MANFYADIPTVANGPAFGQPLVNRMKANKLNGRVRYFAAMYQAPSSGAAPAIADKIFWGKLPLGSRIINHLCSMQWTAGTASCTLNLGDSIVPARHLAATAVTSAGAATPLVSAITQSTTCDIVTGSNVITDIRSMGAVQPGYNIVGTGIPLGAYVISVDKVGKTAVISAPATATTNDLATTTNGGGYEVTDDSNSIGNLYASTTDDATLVSVVAGAQVANNQVIVLKIAYVQD